MCVVVVVVTVVLVVVAVAVVVIVGVCTVVIGVGGELVASVRRRAAFEASAARKTVISASMTAAALPSTHGTPEEAQRV